MVIDMMLRAADEHDILYVHDCNLRFQFATDAIPTVIGVHDLVYAHTLTGALNANTERLITGSDYAAACLREVFTSFRPLGEESLYAVPYGFSSATFRPQGAARMRRELGLAPDTVALLFPHRPDPAKGVVDSLTAISLLRDRLPAEVFARLRLLLPEWQDPEDAGWATAVRHASDLGLTEVIFTHPWIPRARMGEYYSLGTATLCIGTFPEAFGNVHVESTLCGTPAVVSRVAAQRFSIPDDVASHKVDPGDVVAVADRLTDIILRGERTNPELRQYLESRYSARAMLGGYERALLDRETRRPRPILTRPATVDLLATFRIPPWAALLSRGFYNDYSGYSTDQKLLDNLDAIVHGATLGGLLATGNVTRQDVAGWLRDGHLVNAKQ
jgi:glycosyltransferase involved in cell wall biosynthesis